MNQPPRRMRLRRGLRMGAPSCMHSHTSAALNSSSPSVGRQCESTTLLQILRLFLSITQASVKSLSLDLTPCAHARPTLSEAVLSRPRKLHRT
jgi:hypothetical protein